MLFGALNDTATTFTFASENHLATVDPVSGAVTIIGQTVGQLDALAFAPASPGADLMLIKSGPASAEVGSPFTYTLSITNSGPISATQVTVTDSLPSFLSFVSASPGTPVCAEASGTLTCNLGVLNAGEPAVVSIAVNPLAGGLITNTATVMAVGGPADPDTSNNSGSASTTIGVDSQLYLPLVIKAPAIGVSAPDDRMIGR